MSLLTSVEMVRLRLSSKNQLLGILLTMVVPTTGRGPSLARSLRDEYGERVFRTEIASSPALEQAPTTARTIFQFAPRSRAAASFQRLAAEVLDRLRLPRT